MPQPIIKGNISGANIKKARENLNLLQSDLISKIKEDHDIKYSQTMLSRIENGTRMVSDIELQAFSKTLKLTPNELLDWKT